MAREFVIPQLRKILAQGRTITRKSPAERLHRLRIEIKRLRYQLEFLREPYGDALKQSTRRLARLQNTLGDHQDACVADNHLRRYRINHELGKRQSRLFKRLSALEQDKARQNHQRFFKDWRKFEREAKALKQLFC
jgi:CHAD domain-containing protein